MTVDPSAPITELGTELSTLLIRGFAGKSVPSWNMYVDDVEQVPELAWPNSVNTFEKMRNDAQISGLLAGLTLPIRRYRWVLDPGEANPEAVAKLADDLALPVLGDEQLHSVASSTRQFNHDTFLRHALLSLAYGFMPFEIVGEIVDGWWRMSKLSPRMPRTVMAFSMDPTGTLQGIRQTNMPLQQMIPADRLVLFTWDKEGAHFSGRSVLRPMYKHWLIKDRLLRIDAMKHERNGMGVPIATASPNASLDEIKALNLMAQQLKVGDASGGALPPGSDMKLIGTTGSIPDTIASIKYHDEAMARSMLMMFMQLGTTESGSRALGESLIDWFALAQDAVAGWYAETMQEHFIENWVRWNVGEGEAAPRLTYERAPEELALNDLVNLVNAGAIHVDPELEAHLRTQYNLPQHDESLTPPAPVAPASTQTPSETPQTNTVAPAGMNMVAAPSIAASGRRWRLPRFWKQQEVAALKTVKPDRAMQARLPDRTLRRNPYAHEVMAQTDFSKMETRWVSGTDGLIEAWKPVRAAQINELHKQIIAADGDLVKLSKIAVTTDTGAAVLNEHMAAFAKVSASDAIDEAKRQGVIIKKVDASKYEPQIAQRADAIATLMNRNLSETAGRKAVQLTGGSIAPKEVAAAVKEHLVGLSDRFLKDQLGSGMTAAQNEARVAQLSNGDVGGRWYASELLDSNTCTPCSQIDGMEYANPDEALADYPAGGYSECEGGPRCRGSVVTVFDETGANA